MVNNLACFFDSAYLNLQTEFAGFITWIGKATHAVVSAQITFISTQKMMDIALEATVNLEAHLLAKFYEAPGAQKVKRFIKNTAFSLGSAPSPSLALRQTNIVR